MRKTDDKKTTSVKVKLLSRKERGTRQEGLISFVLFRELRVGSTMPVLMGRKKLGLRPTGE